MAPSVLTEIRVRAAASGACLLLREDLADLGTVAEVDAALGELVEGEELVRLREGVYGLTEWSTDFRRRVLACGLEACAKEYARRQGARVRPTEAQRRYNAGLSSQVPNACTVGVDREVCGEVSYRGKAIAFERV